MQYGQRRRRRGLNAAIDSKLFMKSRLNIALLAVARR